MKNLATVETGPVTMKLWDDGYYPKLNMEFPTVHAALEYRRRFLGNMYWGSIFFQGNAVVLVNEFEENEWTQETEERNAKI